MNYITVTSHVNGMRNEREIRQEAEGKRSYV
jgi:hypothetical protein